MRKLCVFHAYVVRILRVRIICCHFFAMSVLMRMSCVHYAILSTRPLVQVLRLVDAEKKPAMGFIYNAMDEAKELIAHNLGGEEASYREIWDIIDARWEVQLHRHLHAAAYYLNPQFQYSEKKSSNPEVKLGLYHYMDRLIPEQADRELADLQLVIFKNKEGFFGLNAAKQPFPNVLQLNDGSNLVIPPLSYRVLL
ncbi:uncharacterized protein LOC114579647 [Dendrobium catenatum]|uniref:uncharacterized protein LOC114579647 n=1 Tax=Dendrobium catenatum TaxID=906689 RepID=UPI00109EEE8B|nr:uncharacterized protein LOC114579647 [Dendrobium catenatum]